MRRVLVWAFVTALLGWPCFGIDLKVPLSLLPAGYGKATVSFQVEETPIQLPHRGGRGQGRLEPV